MSELQKILAIAYRDRVNKSHAANAAFATAAKIGGFIDVARAEYDRLVALEAALHPLQLQNRCFASAQHLHFLRTALAQHQQEQEMPSKLKALADHAKSAVADVERQAEQAANRLENAKQRAQEGIGRVNAVAGDIEQSASDLNDFANQTSNFPPLDEK